MNKPPVIYGRRVKDHTCPECHWRLAFEPVQRSRLVSLGLGLPHKARFTEWVATCPNPACPVDEISAYTEQPV